MPRHARVTPFRRTGPAWGKGLALLVLCLVIRGAGSTGSAAGSVFGEMAAELVSSLPRGSRVAVLPQNEFAAGASRDVADRIFEDLTGSLFRAGQGILEFVVRRHLERLIDEAEEFHNIDVATLVESAAADVAVVCSMVPLASGLELHCRASEVTTGRILSNAEGTVPGGYTAASAIVLDTTLSRLSQELSRMAGHAGSVINNGIIHASNGQVGALGAYVGNRLQGELMQHFRLNAAERKRSGDRVAVITGTEPEPEPPNDGTVHVDGVLWNLEEDMLEIEVSLHRGGRKLGTHRAGIAKSVIPARFMSDRVHSDSRPYFEAAVVAVVGDRFWSEAAIRAARNLARAHIISQALGLPGPVRQTVRSQADAARALPLLSYGIPYDEEMTLAREGNGIHVHLRARVGKVGMLGGSSTTARLSDTTFRAMQPVTITVESLSSAYVSVYAWSADHRVTRLYPYPETPVVLVESGERLILPGRDEQELLVEPLPGSQSDHEAIIVVSSASRLPFETLAPVIAVDTMQGHGEAVEISEFLDRLARLNLAQADVIFLPYRVSR